jgi:hypothetical protein
LNVFRTASGENVELDPVGDLIKISLLGFFWFFGEGSFFGAFILFSTKVHSWGLVVLVEFVDATVAKEGGVKFWLVVKLAG